MRDSNKEDDTKVTLLEIEVATLQDRLYAGTYQDSYTIKVAEQNTEIKKMERLGVAQDVYIGQLISDDAAQYEDTLSFLPAETTVECAELSNTNANLPFVQKSSCQISPKPDIEFTFDQNQTCPISPKSDM